MGTKWVFSFKKKVIYFTWYRSSEIDIILRQNLNIARVCYIYAHANFQGEETFM